MPQPFQGNTLTIQRKFQIFCSELGILPNRTYRTFSRQLIANLVPQVLCLACPHVVLLSWRCGTDIWLQRWCTGLAQVDNFAIRQCPLGAPWSLNKSIKYWSLCPGFLWNGPDQRALRDYTLWGCTEPHSHSPYAPTWSRLLCWKSLVSK